MRTYSASDLFDTIISDGGRGGGAFEGLTMNVEFFENNTGRSKKCAISKKIRGGGRGGGGGE